LVAASVLPVADFAAAGFFFGVLVAAAVFFTGAFFAVFVDLVGLGLAVAGFLAAAFFVEVVFLLGVAFFLAGAFLLVVVFLVAAFLAVVFFPEVSFFFEVALPAVERLVFADLAAPFPAAAFLLLALLVAFFLLPTFFTAVFLVEAARALAPPAARGFFALPALLLPARLREAVFLADAEAAFVAREAFFFAAMTTLQPGSPSRGLYSRRAAWEGFRVCRLGILQVLDIQRPMRPQGRAAG